MNEFELSQTHVQIMAHLIARWKSAIADDCFGAIPDVDCLADDTGYQFDVVSDCLHDLEHCQYVFSLPGELFVPTKNGLDLIL